MGNHVRKICLSVLKMGEPWASMSIHAEERSWLWRMPDQWWVGSRIQAQVHVIEVEHRACCNYGRLLLLPCQGPLGSFPSPWLPLAGVRYSLQSVSAQCKSGACQFLIHLWSVVYLPRWSFESSRENMCSRNHVYIFEYVISPIWIPECSLRDAPTFIGTDGGPLALWHLSVQNPPVARLDGYAFRQVYLSRGIIFFNIFIGV